MKSWVVVLLLILPLGLFAQNVSDSSWAAISAKYHQPVFVVNGELIGNDSNDKRLTALKPQDVFELTFSNGEGQNTVKIITMNYVRHYNETKIGAFSREYEAYLKSHNNNDGDIQYIVHNDPLEKREVLSYLYKLPAEKIVGVTFTDRPALNGVGTQKVVIIEVKVGE